MVKSKGLCKAKCLIALPPMFEGKLDYAGGMSDVCKRVGYAWFSIRMKNLLGQSIVNFSINLGAHEFGHLKGADHDDSNTNIMSTNLALYANLVSWNNKAKQQIKMCSR